MSNDKMKKCPHCGAELKESATFCIKCGNDIIDKKVEAVVIKSDDVK